MSTTQKRTHRVSQRRYSPSASVHVVHAMHPVVQALLVLGVIIANAIAVYGAVKGSIAERESRLQRLEVDEMNIRLELSGIPKHKPGDKP